MNKNKKVESYIIYNGQKINYIINYKNIKNINLKIKENIYISAPYFIQNKQIINFLYSNIEKISDIQNKNSNNIFFNPKKNIIRILGENYQIKCTLDNKKNTWKIIGNEIKINLKNINDKENVLRKVLKKKSEEYIIQRINEISNVTKIKFNSIKIKWMIKKWGYCDSKNNIVISSKTVILDKDMIDYIIIHELCHTIEHNHSKKFWDLVNFYYPNYKLVYKKIKCLNII